MRTGSPDHAMIEASHTWGGWERARRLCLGSGLRKRLTKERTGRGRRCGLDACMAEYYSARISFNVVYRAKEGELVTCERAEGLAQTMLAVLRGSPKVKVVDLSWADVEEVEEA